MHCIYFVYRLDKMGFETPAGRPSLNHLRKER